MCKKQILNFSRELVCLGELKDNDQGSSLLPSVCWQRGEAVYRQEKSLLETRKVQLECVFQVTLQKIINQHHNYSHACLSWCGAAHRGGRREWCCGPALDTLGNVTGTLRPWALSPESLPQPACMAQPPSAVGPGGQVMGHRQPPPRVLSRGCASSWAPVPASPGTPRPAGSGPLGSQSHTSSGTPQPSAAQPNMRMAQRDPWRGEFNGQPITAPLCPGWKQSSFYWGFSYSQLSDFSFPELLSS